MEGPPQRPLLWPLREEVQGGESQNSPPMSFRFLSHTGKEGPRQGLTKNQDLPHLNGMVQYLLSQLSLQNDTTQHILTYRPCVHAPPVLY